VRVVARPVVVAGAAAILATYIAFLGILFLLPQYLQYVQDESVLASALVLSPIGIATVIAAPFTATVLGALGVRWTIAGGLIAMAAATALLLVLSATTSLLLVIVSTAVLGAAIPLTVAPATAVIMDDVGEAKAGDGGAVNQLARQVGGALGVAIVGSMFAAIYTSQIDGALTSLPASLRDQAGESIEHARDVVATADPASQAQLLAQVDNSFDVAARAGFAVAIAALLLGAVASAIGLRTRRR
jgi:predicted MFS family arabinose efflux permease